MADILTHREQRKAETKQLIYTTGIRLFSERGYSATPVSSIARGARIAPRTFFTYYASKKDILFEVPQQYCSQIITQLTTKPADVSTLEVFRLFLHTSTMSPPPEYFTSTDHLVYAIIFYSPELQEYASAIKQRLIDAFSYGFAQDMDCEIDDFAAKVSAETIVNSFWSAGTTLFPYDRHFNDASIDAYFANLSVIFERLQRQLT